MKTQTVLLPNGKETKSELLAWFQRRGFWKTPNDSCFIALNRLNVDQLDVLAGHVTNYGMKQFRAGQGIE